MTSATTGSGDTLHDIGQFGVWRGYQHVSPELAAEIEKLGFGAVWLGSSPGEDLETVEGLLAATEHLVVATGIVNVWAAAPAATAASYHRIEQRFPGRFLLGIGIGHPEHTAEYRSPYEALVEYLDVLDAEGVPADRRVLAALGPRVLRLARDRTRGAHPYLVPATYTRQAREILGVGPLLAPEHKVVLETDPVAARAVGRPPVDRPYLHLRNYVSNLERLGWTEADIADGGSDALIDALVAHGTASAVAAQLREHLAAGADHVPVQVLPQSGDPLPALRELAAALELPGA
ncbi:TIGR03620 family F420-dependent LLM class oxidoreductase [Nakamurella sp. YIM 132087]|uniref:TIGR03620 family F420-dependent LLM class oxidoreductase n=1 Tax=Nakamurella alba TaxID=2665158 RepID=A0A7K1FKU6_9ACTN|nr:LLM class F420-dependent oxidoreductase [Nakamurella alba]MTD14777.1 TIGR03620 family F420-dependent LLM class oxidoreductase [Nakamurella alba]